MSGLFLTPEQAFAQGVQALQTDRLPEAEQMFQFVLARHPRHADSLHLLGLVYTQSGRAQEATRLIRKAVEIDPRSAQFHNNLGMAQRAAGRLGDAEASFRRAISLRPDYARAMVNLGQVLAASGKSTEAIDLFRRALALSPGDLETTLEFAALLERDVRLTEAAAAYDEAIRIDPGQAVAHNALGNLLADLGRLDESVAAYREAIRIDPGYMAARSNLIMTLHSQAHVTATDLKAEALAYAAQLEPQPAPVHPNPREAGRKLRVGYVSADLRVHPVGFFLDQVLPAHDPGEIEVLLYSDVLFPDEQSATLKRSAVWREIAGRPDADVARMIREDRIDILVDLAGHTGSNRLPLFALRPAPVQASWLGYFGTTGLTSIDHVIADAVVLPEGDEAAFTEIPLRIAAPYLCWSPPEAPVPTRPFPALSNGYVTFGCFNNRAKITPEVVAGWSRVLAAAPGSRLFLKSWSLADPGCRAGLESAFAAHGITPERLEFEGLSPRAEGLEAYNRVDIALDPFPFGGCTTTADTLWMGVPLVTLDGDRWSGRMSRTILETVGLGDWVAPSLDAYVQVAASLATDLSALAPLRAGLRERLASSAFCDGPGFTRRLEAAFRQMWRAWCDRRQA